MSKLVVRRKPDCATWEYRFEGATIKGKRKQYSKSGFRTKKEAMEAGAKALGEYNTTGTVILPSEMSIADLLDTWMDNYVKINLSDSTMHGYSNIIEQHIKPAIGGRMVKTVTTQILQELVNSIYIEKKFAWSSMKNIVTVLKGSFRYAQKTLKIMLFSPAEDVMLPKKGPENHSYRVHEIDEIERILTYLMDKPHQYYAALTAYYTGMRISEVYGLTWDAIDFEHGLIKVNKIAKKLSKNYKKGRKRGIKDKAETIWYFGDCKTTKSFRIIPVGDKLLNELAEYKAMQERDREEYGIFYKHHFLQEEETTSRRKVYRIITMDSTRKSFPDLPETHPVFVRADGRYNGTNTWSHANQAIKEKLGIDFSFHDFRHTHATMLLEAGASIKDIQERLGHNDAQTTLNMYIENSPKMSKATAEIFESTSAIDTSTLRDPDLYRVWQGMVKRCRTAAYRARGIGVSEIWNRSYEAFFEWALSAGYRQGAILCRKDEEGDFKPSNCYWYIPVAIERIS